MLFSPAFLGALDARPALPGQPAPRSIQIDPRDPPPFASLPATWTPTVYVTGLDRVKWAVFHVSTSGAYTSDMLWQEVDATAGSFVPSAPITQERDRLVVKSLDETVEDQSTGALIPTAPPPDTGGLSAARAFLADLTVGLNVEGSQPVLNGWLTSAQLAEYRAQGATHISLSTSVLPGTGFPDPAAGGLDFLLDAGHRAMAAGLKATLCLVGSATAADMADPRVLPYLRAAGARIAARGWDAGKYAVGAAQQYAGGSNAEHRVRMHEAYMALRGELPGALLVVGAAQWNHPDTLTDGTFQLPAGQTRHLVSWQHRDPNAGTLAAAQGWQEKMAAWATANNQATFCGDWATGPSDNSNGAATATAAFPTHIEYAARGMGQQRPVVSFVTAEAWWRLNQNTTGALRPEVAAAVKAGDAHIRAQSWYTGQPPAGAGVPRIQVLHRGQSNAYFADMYGAPGRLQATLAALAGVPVDVVSRREDPAGDNTIHSATYSYFAHPDSPWRWLDVPGGDYGGSQASGWTNLDPMIQALTAVSRFVSSDPEIPLYDLRVHWEYDLGMWDGAAIGRYRDGAFELHRRIRDALPKTAGKHVLAVGYCPYQGGSWQALDTIRAAWEADTAAGYSIMACGNMLDGEPNTQYNPEGDPAHWGEGSGPRIYPRIAFRLARHAWERGWLPASVDLSDCPSEGPYIQSASRSGNSLNLVVGHDKGTALVSGADGIDWAAFTASNGDGSGQFDATGGSITGPNSIRLDFPAAPPVGGLVWHAALPNFRRRKLIRDNWHDMRPAKYASVPNVGVVEFPLRHTLKGVPYTASGGGVEAPPIFFEDFESNTQGQLDHLWGATQDDKNKVSFSGGLARIDGSGGGAGLMVFPGGPSTCFGNGLFEIRAKLIGENKGGGSGPALVLWPASDVWPGPEIDIGELTGDGQTYMATHWYDPGWRNNDGFRIFMVPEPHDRSQFHTYAAFLQTDKITYYVDGVVIGTDTINPAPDYAHGGENHSIGIMNRSWETAVECEWVRWTPEATVLAGGGGGVTPPAASIAIAPKDPGTLTETTAGQGASRTFTVTTTGMSSFQWVVVRPDWTWRTSPETVQTTGTTTIVVTFLATGEFVKVLKSDGYAVYDDSQAATVNAAAPPSGPPADTTAVDAEYPARAGAVLPVGKSGLLLHGQSNMGYLFSEGVWFINEGLSAILGVEKGTFNPQISGLDRLDAYGLPSGYKSNPEIFTIVGGTGLYSQGGRTAGAFMDPFTGGPSSGWNYGVSGYATQRLIQQLMTADERASCYGVFNFHSENDCQDLGDGDYSEYLGARLNFMAKVRSDFGRNLPWFFVYPIPFGGGGHAMIRRAWNAIIGDPANNAHMACGQTCDSRGGERYGPDDFDYQHRAPDDLRTFARRSVFGIARVLNSQRGVGNRNLPSFGPKMVHCHAESGTTTVVTVAHDRGTTLYLGGGASDGRGWTVSDNGADRSVSGVAVLNATQLRLTHGAVGSGPPQRQVAYCLYGQELGRGGAVYDNFSARPLPSGWPSQWGSEWRFDWPLRGSLVPMASSGSAYSG